MVYGTSAAQANKAMLEGWMAVSSTFVSGYIPVLISVCSALWFAKRTILPALKAIMPKEYAQLPWLGSDADLQQAEMDEIITELKQISQSKQKADLFAGLSHKQFAHFHSGAIQAASLAELRMKASIRQHAMRKEQALPFQNLRKGLGKTPEFFEKARELLRSKKEKELARKRHHEIEKEEAEQRNLHRELEAQVKDLNATPSQKRNVYKKAYIQLWKRAKKHGDKETQEDCKKRIQELDRYISEEYGVEEMEDIKEEADAEDWKAKLEQLGQDGREFADLYMENQETTTNKKTNKKIKSPDQDKKKASSKQKKTKNSGRTNNVKKEQRVADEEITERELEKLKKDELKEIMNEKKIKPTTGTKKVLIERIMKKMENQ